MNNVLLKLGSFTFSVSTAAYQDFKRSWKFNWPQQQRLQAEPVAQFTGAGAQSLALSGAIYPGQYGSAESVPKMVEQAAQGKPLLLVAGTGDVLGYWSIVSVEQSGSALVQDGRARRINFSLSLIYYGASYAV